MTVLLPLPTVSFQGGTAAVRIPFPIKARQALKMKGVDSAIRSCDASLGGVIGIFALVLVGPVNKGNEIIAPTPIAAREILEDQSAGGFRLGRLDFHPRLRSLVLFDDNILAHSIVRKSDLIWHLSPGARLALGDPESPIERSFSLDYSPAFVLFSNYPEYNTVDHTTRAAVTWPLSKLTLSLVQGFARQSSVVLGFADRVRHQNFQTTLNSRYQFSDKAAFELSARQSLSAYEESSFVDSREWVGEHWFSYIALPKLSLGAGVTAGFLELEDSCDQLYERLSMRAFYSATGKLDLNTSMGGERRDSSGTDSASTYPVFSVGADYRPIPTTTIGLSASRGEQNSASIPGENYTSAGFSGNVRHRMGERFIVALVGGYHHAVYHLTHGSLSETRTDQTLFVRPGFDWMIRPNWWAGIFYSYRQNTSDESYYEYANSQVGVHTVWFY